MGFGMRLVAGLGLALFALPTGAAQAQAPGPAMGGPGRPGGVARVGGHGGPAWHRPGRGFAGRGFRGAGFGGLAAGGLYPWGGDGAGYGAGVTNVDASVRTYPSPDELVPAAWSYGTYGIPTVPGVAPPPKASPVVYVIESGRTRRASPPQDAWVGVEPEATAGGARVVSVRVPAR